jgi:DNA polymerase-1
MNLQEAYRLMHFGAIALAEVEANGMRVDIPYLDQAIVDTAAEIKQLETKLKDSQEYRLQCRRYGQRVNLTSRDQLASVLYGDLGHDPNSYTKGGKPQLDEAALEKIGSDYTKMFLHLEKLNKLHGTYLTAIRREVEGEYIHAFFGLHLVRSYRGQSDSPNLQNVPIRDPLQGPVIRKAFIPRQGCALVETDYSSLEVMVACALSGDPKLTYDATQGDMHRDMAAECYMLDKSEVMKPVRQATKGGFVFAEFYGDWYKQVARNLWGSIDTDNLKTKDGRSLYEHLADHGIPELGECDNKKDPLPGTFEHHIKAVEDRFWNDRFKVYHAKRKEWIEDYRQKGYIDIATGFRCHGPMGKNQVMNYHIQGPAFHCLLWSLITLIAEIKRRGMETKIISQIHDSIIADVPLAEVPEYLQLVRDITTKRIKDAYKWITVDFRVEAEIAHDNWHGKRAVEILS